jgi:5,6-dimethylbenzimidazole synthase
MTHKKSNDRRNFIKKGTLLGGGLLLLGSKDPSSQAAEGDDNLAHGSASDATIWDVLKNRRAVRQFRPDVVPDEDITRIIDAARMAPTSGNQQPWKFLVVRDKQKIDQMKEACIKRFLARFDKQKGKMKMTREQFKEKQRIRMSSSYFSASVYIVVLTDNQSKYPTYNHWDGPLAAGYLMLAARALGYGTVHITDTIPDSVTKTVLQIPDNYTRVCITPVGVPSEWPKSPPKKDLEEFIAYESL